MGTMENGSAQLDASISTNASVAPSRKASGTERPDRLILARQPTPLVLHPHPDKVMIAGGKWLNRFFVFWHARSCIRTLLVGNYAFTQYFNFIREHELDGKCVSVIARKRIVVGGWDVTKFELQKSCEDFDTDLFKRKVSDLRSTEGPTGPVGATGVRGVNGPGPLPQSTPAPSPQPSYRMDAVDRLLNVAESIATMQVDLVTEMLWDIQHRKATAIHWKPLLARYSELTGESMPKFMK